MGTRSLATTVLIYGVTLTGCDQYSIEPVSVDDDETSAPRGLLDSSMVDELALALAEPSAVEGLTIVDDPGAAGYEVRFAAFDTEFELYLQENHDLLGEDFQVMRGDEPMTAEEADLQIPLIGSVAGDPGSWARMRFRNGGVEGILHHADRLLELRPDPEVAGDLIMFESSIHDYLPNAQGGDHKCGVVTPEHGPLAEQGEDDRPRACMEITIGLVADHTYVQQLGGEAGAANELTSRMNEVDGIYRMDVDYGFSIEEVVTFANDPGFNGQQYIVPLSDFSNWKGQNMASYGLAHLSVARTQSGTVGLAWLGTLCSSSNGAGVSNWLGNGKSSTLVMAHEIGHNFGANHDGSGAPYIMAPSVNTQATGFSPQSKNEMAQEVAGASCMEPCGDPPGGDTMVPSTGGDDSGGSSASASDGSASDSGDGSASDSSASASGGSASDSGDGSASGTDDGGVSDSGTSGATADEGGSEDPSGDGSGGSDGDTGTDSGGGEVDSGGDADSSDDVGEDSGGWTGNDTNPALPPGYGEFGNGEQDSCACTSSHRSAPTGLGLLMLGALALRRRRRPVHATGGLPWRSASGRGGR